MTPVFVKKFTELSLDNLYNILKLRSEVFVVEQQCIYQDIDDKDQKALHVLLFKEDKLIGYTRIFKPGDYFEYASIGRVVVSKQERNNKYGAVIMKASIEAINTYFQTQKIKISAQLYLENFYNSLGFKSIGNTYLEDGIPHTAMLKN